MSNPPHCRPNNIRREMGLQGVSPRERLLLKKRKLFDIEATAVKRITKKKKILLNLNNTPVRFSRDYIFVSTK